jgi:viologen exporter family transport system permease protein
LKKHTAYARIAMAQGRRERAELYGRVVFFAVILGVFSSLWRAVGEAGLPASGDPRALVWYLAATEWIVLGVPQIHLEIQEAIRRGDVVYRLGQPASYVMAEFAAGLGAIAFRMPVLGVTAFGCAFAFTRWTPPFSTIVLFIPFGVAAAALLVALYLWIGLLAFWLHDVSPVFWIAQKLMFVYGGLMLPLTMYPAPMQKAAVFTPFPAMLFAPASLVLGTGPARPLVLARDLAIWGGVIAAVVQWTYRRAASALIINGG